MIISLTVGKVDAGNAVLLTDDKRLIEFPSVLLPPSLSSGSIVDITVTRNHSSEASSQKSFLALQSAIHNTYGQKSPSPPILRCRNSTQTSIVLEWDPIDLATADLRSLSLYRNGSKAGNIPRPMEITSTKISGLAVDTEYTFHLILRTSAGQYSSEKLPVRTHKMTDLSGITVTPGVLPPQLRESLTGAVDRIGGKIVENVRIDTTHFVCTEGRGREWEKAVEMNIPVVRPEWVEGCEREAKIVGVRGYYLNADPRLRQVGQGIGSSSSSSSSQQHRPNQSQSSPRTVPMQQGARSPAQTPSSTPKVANPPTPDPMSGPNGDAGPTPPAKDNPQQERESSDDDDDQEQRDTNSTASPTRPETEKPPAKDLAPGPSLEDEGSRTGSFSEVAL